MISVKPAVLIVILILAISAARADSAPDVVLQSPYNLNVLDVPSTQQTVPFTFHFHLPLKKVLEKYRAVLPRDKFRIVLSVPGGQTGSRAIDVEDTMQSQTHQVPLAWILSAFPSQTFLERVPLKWWVELESGGTHHVLSGPPQTPLFRVLRPELGVQIVSAGPAAWPTRFVVKNSGNAKSQLTVLQVAVSLANADVEPVKSHCSAKTYAPLPVPEVAGGSSVDVQVPPPPLLKFSKALGVTLHSQSSTPTPPPPVQQKVNCQFTITATLGAAQNTNDPIPANNSATRTIFYDVPLTP